MLEGIKPLSAAAGTGATKADSRVLLEGKVSGTAEFSRLCPVDGKPTVAKVTGTPAMAAPPQPAADRMGRVVAAFLGLPEVAFEGDMDVVGDEVLRPELGDSCCCCC